MGMFNTLKSLFKKDDEITIFNKKSNVKHAGFSVSLDMDSSQYVLSIHDFLENTTILCFPKNKEDVTAHLNQLDSDISYSLKDRNKKIMIRAEYLFHTILNYQKNKYYFHAFVNYRKLMNLTVSNKKLMTQYNNRIEKENFL